MSVEDCLKLFNLKPDATLNDVKKAYRILAKKNHPDRFVNTELKNRQEDTMVKINEAYNQIILNFKKNKNVLNFEIKKDTFKNSGNEAADYRLYKTGLEYYDRCYEGISKMAKHDIKDREDNLNKAKSCFIQVLNEYPNSDWAFDAGEKLKKIEKLIDSLEKQRNYNRDTQWSPPKKDSGFYSQKFKDLFKGGSKN